MRKNPTLDRLIQMTRETTRTPLFWLLYDRHAELSEAWRGHRVRWPTVAAWVTACGLTDRQGKPIQPGAVKMTWRRVCAALAEEQAAKPVPAPVRSPPPTPARGGYVVPRAPEPTEPYDPEKAMEAIRETIARRSGRPWPPR